MRTFRPVLLATAGLVAAATALQAQSIDPSTFTGTIGVGESITINKTITLPAGGATTVDLFFLADNTGSMGSVINAAKGGAGAILDGLPGTYRFGAGSYLGDPSEPGVTAATAYTQDAALSFDKTATQTGINSWFASGGGDANEANLFALKQVADGAGWRPEAQRLVVWFGDVPGHTETVTLDQAITALQAEGVKVIAFNSNIAGRGIDAAETYYDYAGDGRDQASTIVAATGGALTNSFTSGLSAAQFTSIVNAQITAATSTLDLFFAHSYAGTGLDISIVCTDSRGCDDVTGGESRDFAVTITGLTEGTYSFDVFARGVDAVESDRITVVGDGGPVSVPEPGSLLLLTTGLLGIVVRRRKDEDLA
jgi:hypothetical protein